MSNNRDNHEKNAPSSKNDQDRSAEQRQGQNRDKSTNAEKQKSAPGHRQDQRG